MKQALKNSSLFIQTTMINFLRRFHPTLKNKNKRMNKRKIYLTAILLLGIVFTSLAQTSLFTISYSNALPLGKTSDYIEKYSWRGISIEQRYFIERDLSVGFYIGWNVLNQKLVNYEEDFGNGVLYGTQYRYINTWPILAVVHYH